MIRKNIQIKNKLGLHARASTKLVKIASKYESNVYLIVEESNTKVNAKSIMGIMLLAITNGTKIILEADGTDEKEALLEIEKLINDKFGEE